MKEEEYNLLAAIKQDNLELIKTLTFEPNGKWEYSYTPLMVAADRGCLHIVKYLVLEKGMDVHVENISNLTALTMAINSDHFETVKFLVEQMGNVRLGAYLSFAENRILSLQPIEKQSLYNYIEPSERNRIYRYLTNIVRHRERQLRAAVRNGNLRLARYWLEAGADPDMLNEENTGILNEAIIYGGLEMVACLLENGASVNTPYTPLITAVETRDILMVKHLFLYGKDININIPHRIKERTALMCASDIGDSEMVKFLLEKGADMNVRSACGETALTLAIGNSHTPVWYCLLNHEGTDINIKGRYGCPLLSIAVSSVDDIAPVKALVEKGVDIEATDDLGRTALHIAVSLGNMKIAKYLIEKGADRNALDEHGSTLLHMALYTYDIEIVKYVLDILDRSLVRKENKSRHTALTGATLLGFQEAVELLESLEEKETMRKKER